MLPDHIVQVIIIFFPPPQTSSTIVHCFAFLPQKGRSATQSAISSYTFFKYSTEWAVSARSSLFPSAEMVACLARSVGIISQSWRMKYIDCLGRDDKVVNKTGFQCQPKAFSVQLHTKQCPGYTHFGLTVKPAFNHTKNNIVNDLNSNRSLVFPSTWVIIPRGWNNQYNKVCHSRSVHPD